MKYRIDSMITGIAEPVSHSVSYIYVVHPTVMVLQILINHYITPPLDKHMFGLINYIYLEVNGEVIQMNQTDTDLWRIPVQQALSPDDPEGLCSAG